MRFVLTHIPRTGGTSLFAALQTLLPEAKSAEFKSLAQVAVMSDRELNSYDIISTYIGSKFFDRLEGSWTKIVVLRDPIPRLKSSYWNLRNNSNHISFATPLAKSLGFREYLALRENVVILQATNVQAWTIFGDRSIFFREKHAYLSENKICEIALNRLATYDFIGFTEHLDELWRHMCQKFRWPATQLPILRKSLSMPEFEEASPIDLAFHTALDSEFIRRTRVLYNASVGNG